MSDQRDQPGRLKDQPHNEVDRASADSFPASDPPSHSGITGAGEPEGRTSSPPPAGNDRPDDAEPKGRPTSDRHAMETAQQREDQESPSKPPQGRTP